MAHAPVARPLGEGDFADELGLHPVYSLNTGRRVERAVAPPEAPQPRGERAEVRVREAGADLTRIAELRPVTDSHQEGAEPHARALRLGVAADHHFLPLETLGLEPGHAAAGGVGGVAPLGHRALEAEPAGAAEECAAAAHHVRGVAHGTLGGLVHQRGELRRHEAREPGGARARDDPMRGGRDAAGPTDALAPGRAVLGWRGRGRGGVITLLDQEPGLAAALLVAHAHEHPAAAQAPAVEHELEIALAIPLVRVAHRSPGTAIPDLYLARAVLAGRDGAPEGGVFERMILDVHGEPPHLGVEARTLRHRPALEDAVHLEAEVVVETGGGVLLHDEDGAANVLLGSLGGARGPRLRRGRE